MDTPFISGIYDEMHELVTASLRRDISSCKEAVWMNWSTWISRRVISI